MNISTSLFNSYSRVPTRNTYGPLSSIGSGFPTEEYQVERRDRQNDAHGGVLIAAKRDLIMDRGSRRSIYEHIIGHMKEMPSVWISLKSLYQEWVQTRAF